MKILINMAKYSLVKNSVVQPSVSISIFFCTLVTEHGLVTFSRETMENLLDVYYNQVFRFVI